VALNLKHQTTEQFLARFRTRYQEATRGRKVTRLAKRIMDAFDAGEFTNLQIRTAFGYTPARFATFKTKLENQRTRYEAVESEVGE